MMFLSIFSISSVAVKDIVIEEGSMDRKYLLITCFISHGDQEIQTYALIDCGATSYTFIDEDFACHHQLPLCPIKNPHTLKVIDLSLDHLTFPLSGLAHPYSCVAPRLVTSSLKPAPVPSCPITQTILTWRHDIPTDPNSKKEG
jgi:hypothetical protein